MKKTVLTSDHFADYYSEPADDSGSGGDISGGGGDISNKPPDDNGNSNPGNGNDFPSDPGTGGNSQPATSKLSLIDTIKNNKFIVYVIVLIVIYLLIKKFA